MFGGTITNALRIVRLAIAAACVFNFKIGPVVVDNVTGPGFLSAVAALIAMIALLFVRPPQLI